MSEQSKADRRVGMLLVALVVVALLPAAAWGFWYPLEHHPRQPPEPLQVRLFGILMLRFALALLGICLQLAIAPKEKLDVPWVHKHGHTVTHEPEGSTAVLSTAAALFLPLPVVLTAALVGLSHRESCFGLFVLSEALSTVLSLACLGFGALHVNEEANAAAAGQADRNPAAEAAIGEDRGRREEKIREDVRAEEKRKYEEQAAT